MDSYKSNEEIVNYNIETIFDKLSDFENFSKIKEMGNIPPELKSKIDSVEFTSDSISFKADPVGMIKLVIEERTRPSKLVLSAATFPIPFKAVINLEKIDETSTRLITEFQIELNIMLRAMASKPLSDGAIKFGQMLASLPYDRF